MPTTTPLGRRARFAAITVVLLSGALLVATLLTARHNRLPTGGGLGADYLAFYDAGNILRRLGPTRLYDLPLQSAEYHANLPGEPPDAFLPYAYAPHVAAFFAPLSLLPYAASYTLWTLISTAAYAVAIVVAIRAAGLPRTAWKTTAWVAASFEPFAFECIHGGQISTLATALLSIAAMLSIAGQPVAAGLALGCCCYKPTLLVILVPALLLTRRWSTLAGFITAVVGWAMVDLIAFGPATCRMYVNLLTGYAGHSALDFRLAKFIDVHSFILLLGGSQNLATAATVAAVLIALRHCVAARSSNDAAHPFGTAATPSADADRLFWASALAWTPVANLYAGAYDAVLVVPATILAVGVLQRRSTRLPRPFIAALIAMWLTPWFTSVLAVATGVQIMSLATAALALSIARLAHRPAADIPWPTKRPARTAFHFKSITARPALLWVDDPSAGPDHG